MSLSVKAALLRANKLVIQHKNRHWRLDCHETKSGRFVCNAQNLTPKTAKEAESCFTDLWESTDDNSLALKEKFVQAGNGLP